MIMAAGTMKPIDRSLIPDEARSPKSVFMVAGTSLTFPVIALVTLLGAIEYTKEKMTTSGSPEKNMVQPTQRRILFNLGRFNMTIIPNTAAIAP
jgi:hypothetical protein